MLELPEVLNMADKLRETVAGKVICNVLPPTKIHKFCWYNGEPDLYGNVLKGRKILDAKGFGIFAELVLEGEYKICFNDGVNVRILPKEKIPKNYQLLIILNDDMALVFTVAMYGGIILHKNDYDNEYYEKSRQAVLPFSPEFRDYYKKVMEESKPSLSAKAFLAAEQRFPGIGNGVLQDILFAAKIHPKRKLQTLSDEEKCRLLECLISVLYEMTEKGGRDTEKDLFGNPGRYQTKMSKNTWKYACPVCNGPVTKETYMGGSVYYCPVCQKLPDIK